MKLAWLKHLANLEVGIDDHADIEDPHSFARRMEIKCNVLMRSLNNIKSMVNVLTTVDDTPVQISETVVVENVPVSPVAPVSTAAPVGNKTTTGYSGLFSGTRWG